MGNDWLPSTTTTRRVTSTRTGWVAPVRLRPPTRPASEPCGAATIYLPFGADVNPQTGADNFRFTGQEFDDSLKVYDYGARYYDTILRRFVQIDSYLGDTNDPRTLNRFSYALNNPLI